ncbi:MAG TPA: AMP-binding protein, partial [Candidatus Dormibacteraeota bacterium]|nr:AMP-binding protein [Candidatus Dormibacteraeota bacterium]
MHHCFGCVMGTLAALIYRATLVLPGERFDAANVLATIAAERCTVLYGVPTMFVAELEHASSSRADLSTLRTGIIAGAPVDPELARRVQRELHVTALTVAYGLTEASPVVTQTTVDDPEDFRLGTVGRPIAGAAVKVVDTETGRPLPTGRRGELCTRGPMVMQGYWGMPEETRAAIDAGGWLHTGDLASRDGHGYWTIEGRSKDMVIRGGENIYPAALEAVARRHPSIADAAVVGIPSDYYGEEVFAWIRPASGARLTADEVRQHFAQHLAPFEVPKAVGFLDEFPTTESGKVLKTKLREMALAPAAAAPTPVAATAGVALPLLEVKADLLSPIKASPRPGWNRPETPTWTDHTRKKEKPVPTTTSSNGRKRGKRIKPWGIGTNVREQIEATGEVPIMYQALGTPVRAEHPFNLYNDIRSQPDALAGTFETAHEAVEVARRLQERRPESVIGLGSGTSQYVAQVANAAFARFAGLPGWDFDSLAFLRYPPAVDFRKLAVMAYSGSGSTVDTVAAAKRSREAGAYTVAFTSVDGSPVVQNTDSRILTAGGFDTGGSDTFHYTARVAAAIYLALELGKLRRPGAHDYAALQAKLLETPKLMGERLDAIDARCRTIAERYHRVRGILVVGAGSNYGTAEEIALKFDEMSHIPAKPMLPGRHIHGALGLTDEAILTVLVAPPGPGYEDLVTVAKVTNMLKTPAVAIVSDDDTQIGDLVDYVVRVPLNDETLFSVLAVLPGQLLPYWCG